jgi:Amt family ammonium transporter
MLAPMAVAQETPAAEPMPPEPAASTPDAVIVNDEVVAEPAADSATGDKAPVEINTGDHAWMLTSSALVLMMTSPGLALFYCGLVRKKNVLSVMMQCFFLQGLMTVLWALYGYSLAFGGVPGSEGYSPYIGNLDEYVLMKNVEPAYNESSMTTVYPAFEIPGHNIPLMTHMLFQGMFFIITPALICGAFAERMKFSTMVVFSILWGTFVYCPLCHMVWDGGYLAFGGAGALMGGALDFAGGTVVHISSGVSALVCALVLGRRLGFGQQPMPPHNMTYTAVGAGLLWVGWFGFNAGSALAATEQAASAFAATHFAAAAGTLTWAGIEWVNRGKPSVLGACSGGVAGLVCITPASGYVQPMAALVMGVAAGAVCYFACTTLKSKMGYDDSLDAFGVHGVGGTLGAILTGVFASSAVFPQASGARLGLLEQGELLGAQVAAAAVTWLIAAVATFIILKVLDVAMGLRVSQEQELQGLDVSEHGEEGYIFI